MAVSKQVIAELSAKCGVNAKASKAALEANDSDIDAAIAALIDAGKVKPDDLDPDTVSDDLFERAAKKQTLDLYKQTMTGKGLFGLVGKWMGGNDADPETKAIVSQMGQAMQEMLGNKTPEEMMAEDEAREKKRLRQVYKTTPGLKGKKPMSAGAQARLMASVSRRREWLKAHPFTLKLKPFPPLQRMMHEWKGEGKIKAFAGTQTRRGGYTSRSSRKASDGTFALDIPRLCKDDASPMPPSPEQVAAYQYLVDHQDEVTENVMAALVNDYARTRKMWIKHDPDIESELPEIKTTMQMRKHVGIGILHMFDIAKAGVAYYGLELGCTWDEEHGAGVIMHKDRVIEAGQADTSFSTHHAIRDGGNSIKKKKL